MCLKPFKLANIKLKTILAFKEKYHISSLSVQMVLRPLHVDRTRRFIWPVRVSVSDKAEPENIADFTRA